MGEEEKVEGAAPAPEGGGEPAPDVGATMPGAFPQAGAGRGIFVSLRLLIILVPSFVILILAGLYGAYSYGKIKSLYREGMVKKSNKYIGPVYPFDEIVTNLMNPIIGIDDTTLTDTKDKDKMLELKINLVLTTDNAIDEINKRYPELIDHLFTLVHKKTYEDLDSLPDQNKFKRQIKDEFNNILSVPIVEKVLFEKFRIVPLKPVKVISWGEEE